MPAILMPFKSQHGSPQRLQRINPSEANINTFFFPPKSCSQNQVSALTDDTAHPRTPIQMPLAAERRKKCSRSGGLRSARSVVIYFGVYPQILTSFIRSWHHIQPWQTQFAVLTARAPPHPTTLLSFLFSFSSLARVREEGSRPDRPAFDVLLRKKSAFHKRPVLWSHTDQAKHRSVAL